ncbi:MAG: hypothetical protein AB1540_15555, partial [Bdellovibrionota bacterium]
NFCYWNLVFCLMGSFLFFSPGQAKATSISVSQASRACNLALILKNAKDDRIAASQLRELALYERDYSDTSKMTIESRTRLGTGEWLVTKHPDKPWRSTHGLKDGNTMGNLLWFMIIPGPNQARFIGVKIDGNQMTLPSTDMANSQVVRINKVLRAYGRKAIPIQLFETSSKFGLEQYARTFVREGGIPIAIDSDVIFVHDWSYHASMLFFPVEVIEHAQRQVKFSVEFVDFLRGTRNDSPEHSDFERKLFEALVFRIDYTGSFTGNWAIRPKELWTNGYGWIENWLVDHNRSPVESLKNLVAEQQKGLSSDVKNDVEAALAQFLSIHKGNPEMQQPFVHQGLHALHLLFKRRLTQIRAAVAILEQAEASAKNVSP